MKPFILFILSFNLLISVHAEEVSDFDTNSYPSIPNELIQYKNETLPAKGNEDLVFDGVYKISSVLTSLSKDEKSYGIVRDKLIRDVREKGLYEGLVLPSLRTMDGLLAGNREDLAELILPVIKNLNPKMGEALSDNLLLSSEDSDLDIEGFREQLRNRVKDPFYRNHDRANRWYGDTLGDRWNEDDFRHFERGPLFGTPDIQDPSTVMNFDGCLDGCNRGMGPGAAAGGILGGIAGGILTGGPGIVPGAEIGGIAGGIAGCVAGCVLGGDEEKPRTPKNEPKEPEINEEKPNKPENCKTSEGGCEDEKASGINPDSENITFEKYNNFLVKNETRNIGTPSNRGVSTRTWLPGNLIRPGRTEGSATQPAASNPGSLINTVNPTRML